MARLPQPGGDNGSWGNVLNEFLEVAHTSGGAIKPGAIDDTHITSVTQSKVVGLSTALAGKADTSNVVHVTGNETVAGVKTFTSPPIVPAPTVANQVANKSYVDTAISQVTAVMPSVTMKMYVLETGKTYSREIPLYNDNGTWKIDETMSISFHIGTAQTMYRDMLRVSLSMKEVIANGLYGMYFSTVALDTLGLNQKTWLYLTKTGVNLSEMWGEQAVSWAGATLESNDNDSIMPGQDMMTVQTSDASAGIYHATFRVKGVLNHTSGN